MRIPSLLRAARAWLTPSRLSQTSQRTRPIPASLPARPAPAWVRDAVIYEVFPRVFSAQGGFAGVTARLDNLQKLGITVLWLMPIHPVGRARAKGTVGSPYAVRDYYAINPAYGTSADLTHLIGESHRRGLKVIIDVVANHTSWDSVMMTTPGFHVRDAHGRTVPPLPDWSDVAPLDYGNPALRAYMIDMLRYWIREFDLDGFRCDVAAMVPTDFWETARQELESVKPDLLLLAEAHEPELLVRAFDFDYATPFHKALTAAFTGALSATVLRATWESERRRYPRGAIHLRFSDNHDERRTVPRFGEAGALAASALVFTLDGVPLLYNGMEVGDTTESGAPALFECLPISWGVAHRRPHFPRFYERIIALRRAHAALRTGATEWLRNSDERRLVTYLRRGEGEEFLIAINVSNRPVSGSVEVSSPAAFSEVDLRLADPEDGPPAMLPATLPALSLDASSFRFFLKE